MRSLGLNPSEAELLNILNEVHTIYFITMNTTFFNHFQYDADYSGHIEFSEFCDMMAEKICCVNDEETIRLKMNYRLIAFKIHILEWHSEFWTNRV